MLSTIAMGSTTTLPLGASIVSEETEPYTYSNVPSVVSEETEL